MSHLIGLIALLLSFSNRLDLPRIIFGHLFIFFFSGWRTSTVLHPRANFLEKLVTASLFSTLLTYPATILTTIIEGQTGSAIFSRHLHLSMTILFLISLVLPYLLKQLSFSTPKPKSIKLSLFLPLSLAIYLGLTLPNLNYHDLNGDEYDLGYQSYNLVDGIKAGRKAYLISYSAHPPLSSSLKHFSLNLLEPDGFDHLQDWHFRFSEPLLGLLVIVSSYLLAHQLFNSRVANLTALLLSVNNYLVFLGRIYHREMLLTFFMVLAIYFFICHLRSSQYLYLAGIAFGVSLLTKETAIILLPLFFLAILFHPKKPWIKLKFLFIALLLFSPVILYNLLAYLTTGYADILFSTFLKSAHHPGATPSTPLSFHHIISNWISIATYLFDIYSPFIFLLLLVAYVVSLATVTASTSLLYLWLPLSILFFSLTAVRGYYFVFVTIPLTIILASFFTSKLSAKPLVTITLPIIIYSCFYSIYSNHYANYSHLPRPTSIDGGVWISHPLNQHHSNVILGWNYRWGYKQALNTLSSVLSPNDCLLIDIPDNPLAVRRYFWLNDPIKQHYLNHYPSRFKPCPTTIPPQGEAYLLSSMPQSSSNLQSVNSADNLKPHFYLYQFSHTP